MARTIIRSIGEGLRPVRAGLRRLTCNRREFAGLLPAIEVTSPAFGDHEPIPARFTADGEGLAPPLAWRGVPAEARGLALLVEDADPPVPRAFVHAIVPALPPVDGSLAEGELPNRRRTEQAARMGRNSVAARAWLPPSPPPGHGPHRYCFQLYALDAAPVFDQPPGRTALIRAMAGHVIAMGMLIGTYERA